MAAFLLNDAQKIYSYSTYDVSAHHGSPPTAAARTGLATIVRQVGRVGVWGIAAAGAVTTSSATLFTVGGGAAVTVRLTASWSLMMEAQNVNTSGVAVRLGFVRRVGK